RTSLRVPVRKDDAPLGFIGAGRREVRPLPEKQIALLQNFAAQAVIAMENARLITETREALEQQTATAEVLGVINASPGELQPVFDIVLEKAMELCAGAFRYMTGGADEMARVPPVIATHGVPTAFAEFIRNNPFPRTPGSVADRILGGEPVVHVRDLADDDLYRSGDPHRRAIVELGGGRSL